MHLPDGMFDSMFDGTFDGMFDGMFDGVFDAMLDAMAGRSDHLFSLPRYWYRKSHSFFASSS